MKWLAAFALLPLLAAEPVRDATATAAPAPPLERWRFNARERTARGLAAWKNEKPDVAVPPFDSALRLRPDDPLATYNAGTARLGAGEPGAEALLARAAQGLSADLAPDAYYNLGNSRLAGQNAKGAIDAYREALRRRPDFNEAKRNLELAWKLLEQQQQQQQEQKQQEQKQNQQQKKEQQSGQNQKNEQQGSSDDSSKSGNEPPSQEEQNQPSPSREEGDERSESGDAQQDRGESSTSNAQQRPLPQFHDQQDMTAEQAAAILQAVENLERQQRREQAAERARGKARVEKDW